MRKTWHFYFKKEKIKPYFKNIFYFINKQIQNNIIIYPYKKKFLVHLLLQNYTK